MLFSLVYFLVRRLLGAGGRRPDEKDIELLARYVYVQPGDTLWSIAARTYGNPRLWRAIAAANPNIDLSRIQPGQRLVLPDVTRRSQVGG